MSREPMEAMELLAGPAASGGTAREWLIETSNPTRWGVTHIEGGKSGTDFINAPISSQGTGPILGAIGGLGGVGTGPERTGLVSDVDGGERGPGLYGGVGADARPGRCPPRHGDRRPHICPNSPVIPHEPIPFMRAPADNVTMDRREADPKMEAILPTTNKRKLEPEPPRLRHHPHREGGYIPQVSGDLPEIMRHVTNEPPAALPTTVQDTMGWPLSYGNGIMQPATATIACIPVPGCATGANQTGGPGDDGAVPCGSS